MTIRELQEAFQLEIQNHDQPGILTSDEIFYWLNQAVNEYIEVKFSNDKESFEQTQKLIDELKMLVQEQVITPHPPVSQFGVTVHSVDLPSDYLHTVNERVKIEFQHPNDANQTIIKDESVTESSSNTLNKQLADPYSTHRLHYESARPLRLFKDTQVDLYTDGSYSVSEYYLRYLRKPVVLKLGPTDEDYLDFPTTVHPEIVRLAAQMYLKSANDAKQPPRQIELQVSKARKIQTK